MNAQQLIDTARIRANVELIPHLTARAPSDTAFTSFPDNHLPEFPCASTRHC